MIGVGGTRVYLGQAEETPTWDKTLYQHNYNPAPRAAVARAEPTSSAGQGTRRRRFRRGGDVGDVAATPRRPRGGGSALFEPRRGRSVRPGPASAPRPTK